VIHKAFVAVDEAGAEAAAATAVIMAEAGAAPMPDPPAPIPFRADRPFIVIIRDDPTGAILCMGRVVSPAG
jgi:serpin B